MAMDVLELFDGVKNVVFKEFTYCEKVGADLPVFSIKEPSSEEWNKKAKIQNTKMFIQIMKRIPKNYQEVLAWIHGNEESQPAANGLTF